MGEQEIKWKNTALVLLVGLLAFPVCYVFNSIGHNIPIVLFFALAVGVLTMIVALFWILAEDVKDKSYYGFAFFAFTAVIDLIIGLEMDGVVSGFMSWYMVYGEPYLNSAWGSMVAYIDGTLFFVIYLVLCLYASNGWSYRLLGLYWSTAILNSMIILLLGGCLSKSGLQWCTFFNIPYVIFPVIVAVNCLTQTRTMESGVQDRGYRRSRVSFIVDLLLILLLLLASVVVLLRGLASTGSQQSFPRWYIMEVERVLLQVDPAPFALLQGHVCLYYFLPAYFLLMLGLFNPHRGWVKDLAALTAGASLHAEICQIGISLYWMTEPGHRVPTDETNHFFFWVANLLVAVVPQLVLARTLCPGGHHNKKKKK